MINGLDLFSGIGGISLAISEWVRPIAYCEIDPYCQGILLSRMVDGLLPESPIWNDIKTLQIQSFDNSIDILYGGFPCQDISVAGLGKGLEGKRSGLFFEIVRLAKEIKPTFIFLENVPAITSRGGLRVVREIAEMGYDCRWCVISAASLGALHRRERWFLLGYSKHNGSYGIEERRSSEASIYTCEEGKDKTSELKGASPPSMLASEFMADSCRTRCKGLWSVSKRIEEKKSEFINNGETLANTRFKCERCEDESKWTSFHHPRCDRFWKVEPSVGRVADGIPNRVDRIRALGNAVVPRQAKEAFEILMGLK